MEKLKVKEIFRRDLPKEGWIDSWSKFECLVTSFFMGGDCLEDLDSFKNDDLFLKVHDEAIASTTAGKFLRSFNERQVEKLEDNLIKLAMKARMSIHGEDKDFIFCNDGTFHEQDGQKMEGLGFDYNNNWGLSSLQGYDQYGFCYGFNLRGGSQWGPPPADPNDGNEKGGAVKPRPSVLLGAGCGVEAGDDAEMLQVAARLRPLPEHLGDAVGHLDAGVR